MEFWILLLAGIFLGLVYVLEKKLSSENFHPATFVALISGVSGLVSIPLLLYQFKVPENILFWILAFVSVATYGIGYLFSFKAYKLIDVSEIGLINRLNIVFTAIVAILFLSETYTTYSYIGFLLIFIGSLIIVFKRGKILINKGLLFALIMAMGFGLSAVFDKVLVSQFSPFTYVVINNLAVSLLFFSFREARQESVRLFKSKPIPILLTGILSAISWVGFLFVLQSGAVSKIFPIYDTLSLICIVGMGILFLGEKEKILQKISGSILVIIGVFLLG